MGVGILAPVPASIMRSALGTCAAEGKVAFGSGAWEVFERANQEYGEGIPVLIYPTHHDGDPDKVCVPGFVPFRAIYLGTTPATKLGMHPNPAVRPAITINGPSADTASSFFWEVSDLKQLSPPERIAITSLTAEGQKKPFTNKFTLHGPILVKALFL